MKLSHVLAIVFWLVLLATLLAKEVFYFEWSYTEEYRLSSIFVFAFVLFGWFLADTKERGLKTSMPLKMAVVAVGALAVPYYKFRYIGARAGFAFLGYVLLCLTSVILATVAIDMVIFGADAA